VQPEAKKTFELVLKPNGNGNGNGHGSQARGAPVKGEVDEDADHSRRLRTFAVRISYANSIDFNSLMLFIQQHPNAASLVDVTTTAIQSLDILLRHDPARGPGMITKGGGKKFFNTNTENAVGMSLGKGAVVLQGIFQWVYSESYSCHYYNVVFKRSMRPTRGGMILNLDSAYSPFIKSGTLVEVLFKIIGRTEDLPTVPTRGGRGGRRGGFGGGRGRGGSNALSDREINDAKKRLSRV
jgi:eukaryotic translation initiation factor 2C